MIPETSQQKGTLFLPTRDVPRRMPAYLLMASVFFGLSLLTILLLNRFFLESRILFDQRLLHFKVITVLTFLLPLYYLTDGLRLNFVLRAMGHHLSFTFLMKLVFINLFFSNVTPMATGGGFVQIYFLSRRSLTVGEATAATSIRTMLGTLGMLTLTPAFIFLKPDVFNPLGNDEVLLLFVCVAGLYLTVVSVILFRVRVFKALLFKALIFLNRGHLLSRRRMRSIFLTFSCELNCFSEGFRQFARGPSHFIIGAFLSTCCFLIFLFSFSIVLIKGLGYDVPALTVLAIQAVVTFFMYFTPTPGAVGFAETAYILLFSKLISEHDITLLTICWRFLTIYIGVLTGMLITSRELFKLRRERKS